MHQWKQALRHRIISAIHSHQVLILITMLHIISLGCPCQIFWWIFSNFQNIYLISCWSLPFEPISVHSVLVFSVEAKMSSSTAVFYFNFLGVSWNAVIWIILAVGRLSRWLIAKQNMQSHMRCFLSTISELTQLFPYVYPFSVGKFKSWITSNNRL